MVFYGEQFRLIKSFLILYYSGYEYESQNWDSDEVPATERDLADDAPWKQIQVSPNPDRNRLCPESLQCSSLVIAKLCCPCSDFDLSSRTMGINYNDLKP